VTGEPDVLVRETLERQVPLRSGARGDWADVLRRAEVASVLGEGWSQRRLVRRGRGSQQQRDRRPRLPRPLAGLVLALLVAAVLLIVAPALGLGIPGIDFFRAEKAPPKAVENFDSLSVGAPPGMDPQVIAGEARKLETTTVTGETRIVWVAPTRAGGLCYLWAGAGGGGGCDKLGTTPLSVSWLGRRDLLLGDVARPDPSDFGGIAVHASARYVARVELRFADGSVIRPPMTWVSEPIGQGFFHYSFTPRQLAPGHEISAVVALDAEGDVVTEEATCCGEVTAPQPDAIAAEKSAAVSIATSAGPAVVWQAPTRYEGTCAWLEFEGRAKALGRCMAKGYERNDGLALVFYPTQETVIVYGSAADRYRQLDLHYADGDVQRVIPTGRFFLAEIPPEHLEPDTRLQTITVRDADGQAIPRGPTFSFPAVGTAASPCFRVLPLPPGQVCDGS
jgi:hypothetical protein